MQIVLVGLPQDAFKKIVVNQYTPQFSSLVSRNSLPHRKLNINHVCRLFNTTEIKASAHVAQQTRKH
jgi:hypothetical protein